MLPEQAEEFTAGAVLVGAQIGVVQFARVEVDVDGITEQGGAAALNGQVADTRTNSLVDRAMVFEVEERLLRGGIERDAGRFIALLEAEDLYVDIGPLCYWSHWITPSLEPKRFDTRFFVAPLPPGQVASADLSEPPPRTLNTRSPAEEL